MYLPDSEIASRLLSTNPREHDMNTLSALEEVISKGHSGVSEEWVRDCNPLFDDDLVVEHDGKVFVNRHLSSARIVGVLSTKIRDAVKRADSLVLFKSASAFGMTLHGTQWNPSGETSIPESGVDTTNDSGVPTRKGDGLCASSNPMEAVLWGTPANLMAIEVQKAHILGNTGTKYRFTKAAGLEVIDFHNTFQIMSQLGHVSGSFVRTHFPFAHYNSPHFFEAMFGECDFMGVIFDQGRQEKVLFEDCGFASCTWDMTEFKATTFRGCEFIGSRFSDCDFSQCAFIDCDFKTMHGEGKAFRKYLNGADVKNCWVNGERLG